MTVMLGHSPCLCSIEEHRQHQGSEDAYFSDNTKARLQNTFFFHVWYTLPAFSSLADTCRSILIDRPISLPNKGRTPPLLGVGSVIWLIAGLLFPYCKDLDLMALIDIPRCLQALVMTLTMFWRSPQDSAISVRSSAGLTFAILKSPHFTTSSLVTSGISISCPSSPTTQLESSDWRKRTTTRRLNS